MPQPSIIPVAKSLYLCDGHIGFANQKTDLMGLFNSINPLEYPHVRENFVAFAQLIGGLGRVPFYLDIRFALTDQLVHSTTTQILTFPTRNRLVQLAYTFRNIRFPRPGVYLVELFCNGQWVADTTLDLRQRYVP
jgi:hypothetical protein